MENGCTFPMGLSYNVKTFLKEVHTREGIETDSAHHVLAKSAKRSGEVIITCHELMTLLIKKYSIDKEKVTLTLYIP